MDIPALEFEEPISTPPKLSLFSLPSKPLTLLPEGLTPPLNTVAAIPFLWEEAPGKPRSTVADDPPKSKTVRSLDLPPRLATLSPTGDNHRYKLGNINVGVDVIPSPTTVLGGPYEGAIESSSSEKVVVGSKNKGGRVRMPLRKLMRKERSFRSWRWDNKDIFRDDIDDGGGGDRSPSIRFCSWRWDSFRDTAAAAAGDIGIRRNSFATFHNASTSGFLASMYDTLKQAMPWRSRRL